MRLFLRASLLLQWTLLTGCAVSADEIVDAGLDGDLDAHAGDAASTHDASADLGVRVDLGAFRDLGWSIDSSTAEDMSAPHDAIVAMDMNAPHDAIVAMDMNAPRDASVDAPGASVCARASVGPPDFSRASTGMAVSGAPASANEALVRANYWRTAAGLSALNAESHIQQAALAHANFMFINPGTCAPSAHDEVATCMGFTGEWPDDRMAAAGFTGAYYSEVISFMDTPTSAVDRWIWSVYHREPFFDDVYNYVGYGLAGDDDYHVMDFGSRSVTRITTPIYFPLAGQTDVPTSFNGREEFPRPPTPGDGTWPSGPVISVSFPAGYTLISHALYDESCNPVTYTHNGGGELPPLFFFMYSDEPLASGKRYTVDIQTTLSGGTPWSATWAFTTR